MIAALGTLFLAVLYSRMRAAGQRAGWSGTARAMRACRICSTTRRMVDDGVLVGKNGAFMAAWLYQGEDNASASDEQRNLVSYRINQALSRPGLRLDDPCRCGAASRAALPAARGCRISLIR